ncbi:hypothetical protein H6G96_32640 [Nostoc sp. FACHB-892]|uniref:ribbon-helix-helix domain-containing protein n=1 Tax=Nostoc sp. FACHB-892 TaxID=2692843 RepID=UPI001682D02C|nr:ribbon-helix-helix domain-containing protein [Nostoc sp. FACHB-892]MBD2730940.1 hypothetical protein [Nostoc sp. FACHB-892]
MNGECHQETPRRKLALEEDITVQALVSESLNDLFAKYGKKPRVAESWDDFAQFGTSFQWFQLPIHPASMQRPIRTTFPDCHGEAIADNLLQTSHSQNGNDFLT